MCERYAGIGEIGKRTPLETWPGIGEASLVVDSNWKGCQCPQEDSSEERAYRHGARMSRPLEDRPSSSVTSMFEAFLCPRGKPPMRDACQSKSSPRALCVGLCL